MEINNPKNTQQANTKLKCSLRHRMTPQDARDYELAYAEYNLIHDGLCECESEVRGTLGNQSKVHRVLEVI